MVEESRVTLLLTALHSCACRGFLMLFMEMGMPCFLSCLFS